MSIEKVKANGIFIYINDQRWSLKEIENYYSSALVKEIDNINTDKIQITLDLDKIFYSQVGYFDISIDTPGEITKKHVGRYICLSPDTSIKKNRRLYYYETEFTVSIKCNVNDDLTFIPCDHDYISSPVSIQSDDVVSTLYRYHEYTSIDVAKFSLQLDNQSFTIHIPIPKVKTGNSKESLTFRKTQFWYKEISNNFYVLMPGAISMQCSLKQEESDIVTEATLLEDGIFKFDLSELNETIKMRNNRQHFIVDVQFVDVRQRKTSFLINRQPKVKPYFEKIERDPHTGLMYTDIDTIDGMAEVHLEITDMATHSTIFDDLIVPGRNYFPEMKHDRDYWLKPYMVEKALFSSTKTPMRWIVIEGEKDYSDLSMYHINISEIVHNNKMLRTPGFMYSIEHLEKIEEMTYQGYIKAIEIKNGRPDFRNPLNKRLGGVRVVFQELGKHATAKLYMLDYSEGVWVELYYDARRHILISPNNKFLLSSKYNEYIPLYDDDTLFTLDLKHRKVRNNDIQTDREFQENS